ncbi:MAG: zinc-dependent alcohol dehydrogenase family protein [Dongiaceae bacterium]
MSRMIRFHQFGPPEVLKCEEVSTPRPVAGEVLVRVDAIGVSWNDVLWRQNLAPEQARLPSGIGSELSGRVEAVGEGVEDLPVGTPVASFLAHTPNRYPAYGDLMVMPREALTRYPDNGMLTPMEASVHYTPLLTAYFALVNLARLKPDQVVLTTEASVCLGPSTVQLSKALGARVIASTKNAESRDYLLGLGADSVVVTDEQDLVREVGKLTDGRGVDVVLDSCGGRQMNLLGDLAAPRAKLILYGLNGGNEASFPACEAFRKHLQFFRHSMLDFTGHAELGIEPDQEAVRRALQQINQLTQDGLLKSEVDGEFTFDEVVDAHRYMETLPTRGRISIKVS